MSTTGPHSAAGTAAGVARTGCVGSACRRRVGVAGVGLHGLLFVVLALRAGFQDGVYAVGDELGRPAELADGPVGRVALGDVGGPGVVDQAFGQRAGQRQLAVGDRDQAVAEAVEPELSAARARDAGIEMGEHRHVARPARRATGNTQPVPPVSLRRHLRIAASCRVIGNSSGVPVLVCGTCTTPRAMSTRSQRSVSISPRRIPEYMATQKIERVAGSFTTASMPRCQYGSASAGDEITRRTIRVEPSARRQPQVDRVAQPFVIDAGAPVDAAQERDHLVADRSAVVPGEQGEARLHLAALGGIQRARHAVGEIVLDGAVVGIAGLLRVKCLALTKSSSASRSFGMLRACARLSAGSWPSATLPSILWAIRRAWSSVTGAEAPDDRVLVGRFPG